MLYRYPTYYGIQYVDSGVPEVRGELILENGSLEGSYAVYRFITKETANRFPKVQLKEGDFVMSVRGTVGKVAIVPKWLTGAVITANLIRLRFNYKLVQSDWAVHYLLSYEFQSRLDFATSATTIKTIQAPELESIKFPKPDLEEQKRAVLLLNSHEKLLTAEIAKLEKLKVIKQGLMQDLLTGKVSVESLLTESVAG